MAQVGLGQCRGSRAVRIPVVDGLIALSCQGTDVSEVHLESVGAPAEGLFDEVGAHAGNVELDRCSYANRVTGVALQLLGVRYAVDGAS